MLIKWLRHYNMLVLSSAKILSINRAIWDGKQLEKAWDVMYGKYTNANEYWQKILLHLPNLQTNCDLKLQLCTTTQERSVNPRRQVPQGQPVRKLETLLQITLSHNECKSYITEVTSQCFVRNHDDVIIWKLFSALLAICTGNSPVTDEFPAQRPVTRSFDVFFDLR